MNTEKEDEFEPFVEYENGQLKKKGAYKNKQLHGPYSEYFSNGNIKKEGEYKKGIKYGEFKFYYKNGQLKKVITYGGYDDFSYKTGPFIEFYDDGSLKAQGFFTLDSPTYKSFYKDGTLKEDVIGSSTGFVSSKSYNENGQLIREYNETGPCIEYYSNGQLKEKKINETSYMIGPFESYYKNGQLKEKGTYKRYNNDIIGLDGKYVLYYENGQVKVKGTYKNGRKFKLVEKFYESGQLKQRGYYGFKEWRSPGSFTKAVEGDVVWYDQFEKTEYILADPLDGVFESYYENGHLKERYYSSDETARYGTYVSYDEEGTIISKGILLKHYYVMQVMNKGEEEKKPWELAIIRRP